MTFHSLPFTARPIKATEAVLERIYLAARKGVTGNSLAYQAGMLPIELRRLQEFDEAARMAEELGKSDLGAEAVGTVLGAIRNGDAKAAMDLLKHKFDWVAKQQINMDITKTISVTEALAAAEQRLTIANSDDVTDVEPRMIVSTPTAAAPTTKEDN